MKLNAILIIAVEPAMYSPLSLGLERCGYSTASAANAKEALFCLKTQQVHLAIMDLKLSDMDGMCLVLMIRRLYPEIPLLILTDNDSSANIIKALRLGAQGYLLKPVSQEQIMVCVDEIFIELWRAHLMSRPEKTARIRPSKVRREILREVDEGDYSSGN